MRRAQLASTSFNDSNESERMSTKMNAKTNSHMIASRQNNLEQPLEIRHAQVALGQSGLPLSNVKAKYHGFRHPNQH
jgi:hypothetical protein